MNKILREITDHLDSIQCRVDIRLHFGAIEVSGGTYADRLIARAEIRKYGLECELAP
jgi:hypothetical protein